MQEISIAIKNKHLEIFIAIFQSNLMYVKSNSKKKKKNEKQVSMTFAFKKTHFVVTNFY